MGKASWNIIKDQLISFPNNWKDLKDCKDYWEKRLHPYPTPPDITLKSDKKINVKGYLYKKLKFNEDTPPKDIATRIKTILFGDNSSKKKAEKIGLIHLRSESIERNTIANLNCLNELNNDAIWESYFKDRDVVSEIYKSVTSENVGEKEKAILYDHYGRLFDSGTSIAAALETTPKLRGTTPA